MGWDLKIIQIRKKYSKFGAESTFLGAEVILRERALQPWLRHGAGYGQVNQNFKKLSPPPGRITVCKFGKKINQVRITSTRTAKRQSVFMAASVSSSNDLIIAGSSLGLLETMAGKISLR